MATNHKRSSSQATAVLLMLLFAVGSMFLNLWDTNSNTILDYVMNALERPDTVLSGCLLIMAGSVVLGLVFAVLALKEPKWMKGTALCGTAGVLSFVTYFAVFGEEFSEMITWMGTGAFLYFASMFVAFFISVVAVCGKPREKAAAPSRPSTPGPAPAQPAPVPPKAPTASAPVQPVTPPAQPVGVACPACGYRLSPGMKFCPGCGASAAPKADAPTPSRDRSAICPHCGARQVPAPNCKYCGTPMQ